MTDATPVRQHAKIVHIEVTQGSGDKDRTIEEFIDAIHAALAGADVKRVTILGKHYILDGKVCRVEDYDTTTQERKPGTYPPPWAGGPSEAELKVIAQRAVPQRNILDRELDRLTTPAVTKPVRKPRARSKAAALDAAGDLAAAMRGSNG